MSQGPVTVIITVKGVAEEEARVVVTSEQGQKSAFDTTDPPREVIYGGQLQLEYDLKDKDASPIPAKNGRRVTVRPYEMPSLQLLVDELATATAKPPEPQPVTATPSPPPETPRRSRKKPAVLPEVRTEPKETDSGDGGSAASSAPS